jgi:hypothetical protein
MKERSIENPTDRIAEEVKRSVQMNDDQGQLPTSLESLSPQIIPLRSGLIEDGRVSRFQSFNAEGAAESSNVTVRRKGKGKKSAEFDQLSATGQTSLDVTEFQIGLEEFHLSRNVESADLNEANILSSEEKRIKKPTSRYAQVAWGDEEMRKFPSFHAAFMAGILPKPSSIQDADQSD